MKTVRFIHLPVLLLLTIAFQNCQTPKDKWVLNGSTTNPAQTVYLYNFNPGEQKTRIDSTQIEKGKFSFEHINPDEQLCAFALDFGQNVNGAVEFVVANGDRIKVNMKEEFNSLFSGTPVSDDFNRYNAFRLKSFTQIAELSEVLAKKELDEDQMNEQMLIFKEKMQELENEKIDFLRNIRTPELNSFLILNEIYGTGVIEKELFEKYVNALTPEGAMTNTGHKIHQIFEVIDAYALSRELDILDTATIRSRFNNLDEENLSSEYAREIENFLNK